MRPLRVLHVASECAPFAKTGGLGDVVGALPIAQREGGIDARVVMPLYAGIDWNALKRLPQTLIVPGNGRNEYAGPSFTTGSPGGSTMRRWSMSSKRCWG